MKNVLIIFFLIITGAVAFVLIKTYTGKPNSPNPPTNGQAACTLEAKLCPDGSEVGRVPPDCEFAPCPVGAQISPAPISESRQVFLYYYNPEIDKDETGNVKCSRDGLVGVEAYIPTTITPIKDTVTRHIRGKENLSKSDIMRGTNTEFPLDGFSLTNANLKKDGTLVLTFSDPQNKTGGGSCRVGILWFQIEATAKQFPEVKKVEFLPEELFQP